MEYLTVTEVRDEFGEQVAEKSDAALLRNIDRLAGVLEDNLGHSFGRAAVAQSTDPAHTVAVSATELTIGGDTYAFSTFPTLGDLETAVNGAGDSYSLTLNPKVATNTPSALLKPFAAVSCGSDYTARRILDISALYILTNGMGTSHVYIPLPIANIVSIYEDATALTGTDFCALTGDTWIVRKGCGCSSCSCRHGFGHWSCDYPGNVAITYRPKWWLTVPAAIKTALLEAFSAQGGFSPLASESFGGSYSYSRNQALAWSWQDILRGPLVRAYTVRMRPVL